MHIVRLEGARAGPRVGCRGLPAPQPPSTACAEALDQHNSVVVPAPLAAHRCTPSCSQMPPPAHRCTLPRGGDNSRTPTPVSKCAVQTRGQTSAPGTMQRAWPRGASVAAIRRPQTSVGTAVAAIAQFDSGSSRHVRHAHRRVGLIRLETLSPGARAGPTTRSRPAPSPETEASRQVSTTRNRGSVSYCCGRPSRPPMRSAGESGATCTMAWSRTWRRSPSAFAIAPARHPPKRRG
jgi:hypothetical protein